MPVLLSGVNLDNISASVNSNGDDNDGYPDIDELLASIQQKSVSASTKLSVCGLGKRPMMELEVAVLFLASLQEKALKVRSCLVTTNLCAPSLNQTIAILTSSAISCNNPVNVPVSKPQGGQRDSAQPRQPGSAVAPPQKTDWTRDSLRKYHHRRDATKSVHRKRPRTTAPTGLASAAATVSAALQ
ncbi:hypothetical protein B0O99DRAFT_679405 [Bisporella sp. PMI_857]|nr:hypothetical protein B0O99DRAFT_679405 [Bisporella sp. PMI_857]